MLGPQTLDAGTKERECDLKRLEVAHRIPRRTVTLFGDFQRLFDGAPELALAPVQCLDLTCRQRQVRRVDNPDTGKLLRRQTADLDEIASLPHRFAQPCRRLLEGQVHATDIVSAATDLVNR